MHALQVQQLYRNIHIEAPNLIITIGNSSLSRLAGGATGIIIAYSVVVAWQARRHPTHGGA